MHLLQIPKQYVGNNVLWRAVTGPTTDVSKAQRVSLDDAQKLRRDGSVDVMWPEDYITANTRRVVNRSNVNIDEALAGTGIVLIIEKPPIREVLRCYGCGKYLSEKSLWSGACPSCNTDNRP